MAEVFIQHDLERNTVEFLGFGNDLNQLFTTLEDKLKTTTADGKVHTTQGLLDTEGDVGLLIAIEEDGTNSGILLAPISHDALTNSQIVLQRDSEGNIRAYEIKITEAESANPTADFNPHDTIVHKTILKTSNSIPDKYVTGDLSSNAPELGVVEVNRFLLGNGFRHQTLNDLKGFNRS